MRGPKTASTPASEKTPSRDNNREERNQVGKDMADTFSKQKRSAVMAAIRGKGNQETEVRLAQILRKHRIKGWRRHSPLLGRPDFIFRKQRIAVFVDGCFWHSCREHSRVPKSNVAYWRAKLQRNAQRDRRNNRALRRSGWNVIRFWQHSLAREASVEEYFLSPKAAKAMLN